MPKNDIVFPKQWYLKRIGEDQNGFRKNQRRKGQLGPIMGRYSNQEVSTLPIKKNGRRPIETSTYQL